MPPTVTDVVGNVVEGNGTNGDNTLVGVSTVAVEPRPLVTAKFVSVTLLVILTICPSVGVTGNKNPT